MAERPRAVAKSLPRYLHPGAWWLWALCLAAAASRTTNPILLALILAVAGLVVTARKPDAPWARSFTVFLKLGLVVVTIRVVFQLILGSPMGNHVLFTLPSVPLPDWMQNVQLGGQVTLESFLFSVCDGLRLAVLLACVGAANSLASASRLLKTMPPSLYEAGVAVVVAMTFAPQLVTDVGRVRQARRLRGKQDRGLKGAAGSAMPVFEGALDRAVTLAAAMDARGYGRAGNISPASRRLTVGLMIGGLIGICIGLYGFLSAQMGALLSVPMLMFGALLACAGIWAGGQRSIRTRYRPDPWRWPEWAVSATGVIALASVVAAGILDPASMEISVTPLQWPALPMVALIGVLIAAAPCVLAPPLPPPAAVIRRSGGRAGAPVSRLEAATR